MTTPSRAAFIRKFSEWQEKMADPGARDSAIREFIRRHEEECMTNPQFVKLTDLDDGNPIWVNPYHVIAVTADTLGTWLGTNDGGWNLSESIEQTLEILTNGAHKAETKDN